MMNIILPLLVLVLTACASRSNEDQDRLQVKSSIDILKAEIEDLKYFTHNQDNDLRLVEEKVYQEMSDKVSQINVLLGDFKKKSARLEEKLTQLDSYCVNQEEKQKLLKKDLLQFKSFTQDSVKSFGQLKKQFLLLDKEFKTNQSIINKNIDNLKLATHDLLEVMHVKSNAGTKLYTVKSGDSLSLLAKEHGVSIIDIQRINNLDNDTIYVGQKLKLP